MLPQSTGGQNIPRAEGIYPPSPVASICEEQLLSTVPPKSCLLGLTGSGPEHSLPSPSVTNGDYSSKPEQGVGVGIVGCVGQEERSGHLWMNAAEME